MTWIESSNALLEFPSGTGVEGQAFFSQESAEGFVQEARGAFAREIVRIAARLPNEQP